MSSQGVHRDRVRRHPSRRLAWVASAAAAVVALAAGSGLSLRTSSASSCADAKPSLRVAAAPDIASVVSLVGATLNDPETSCARIAVESSTPAEVVGALTEGTIQPPDVWIPDSSLWLTRADVDKVASATNVTSIASSPLVLAMTTSAARKLRPDGSRPDVNDLVKAAAAPKPLSVQLSKERLSPERVGAVIALSAATAHRPDRRAALTSLLRGAPVTTASRQPLQALSGDAPVAVPASEEAVWALGRAPGRKPLTAVYLRGVAFDYPYAVLSADRAKVDVADQLFGLLRGQRGQHAIQGAGFRNAAGAAGKALSGGHGVDGSWSESRRPLNAASVNQAEKTLAAVNLDARLLAVLDVSGSMAWPVGGPGGPGPSRLSLATKAFARGLSLYPDTTQAGLWVFSKDLFGQDDYRSIVPVSTLRGAEDIRARLTWLLTELRPDSDGGTALYATTLAAVASMTQNWSPGKVNAVVLLSDGKDTDLQGPTLPTVLRTLEAVKNSAKPVPIITIAFGPDSDATALTAISAASGGASYRASNAEQVRQVFLDAVGQRACRPSCPPS